MIYRSRGIAAIGVALGLALTGCERTATQSPLENPPIQNTVYSNAGEPAEIGKDETKSLVDKRREDEPIEEPVCLLTSGEVSIDFYFPEEQGSRRFSKYHSDKGITGPIRGSYCPDREKRQTPNKASEEELRLYNPISLLYNVAGNSFLYYPDQDRFYSAGTLKTDISNLDIADLYRQVAMLGSQLEGNRLRHTTDDEENMLRGLIASGFSEDDLAQEGLKREIMVVVEHGSDIFSSTAPEGKQNEKDFFDDPGTEQAGNEIEWDRDCIRTHITIDEYRPFEEKGKKKLWKENFDDPLASRKTPDVASEEEMKSYHPIHLIHDRGTGKAFLYYSESDRFYSAESLPDQLDRGGFIRRLASREGLQRTTTDDEQRLRKLLSKDQQNWNSDGLITDKIFVIIDEYGELTPPPGNEDSQDD